MTLKRITAVLFFVCFLVVTYIFAKPFKLKDFEKDLKKLSSVEQLASLFDYKLQDSILDAPFTQYTSLITQKILSGVFKGKEFCEFVPGDTGCGGVRLKFESSDALWINKQKISITLVKSKSPDMDDYLKISDPNAKKIKEKQFAESDTIIEYTDGLYGNYNINFDLRTSKIRGKNKLTLTFSLAPLDASCQRVGSKKVCKNIEFTFVESCVFEDRPCN